MRVVGPESRLVDTTIRTKSIEGCSSGEEEEEGSNLKMSLSNPNSNFQYNSEFRTSRAVLVLRSWNVLRRNLNRSEVEEVKKGRRGEAVKVKKGFQRYLELLEGDPRYTSWY